MILSCWLWGRFASPPTKENTPEKGCVLKPEAAHHGVVSMTHHTLHPSGCKSPSFASLGPVRLMVPNGTKYHPSQTSQWNIEKNSTSETLSSQIPWRHVAHCAWVLLETLFKSPLHCFSTTCILWIFQSTTCLRQRWHTDGMPWNTQLGALSHMSLSKVTLPSGHAWIGGSHLACETSPVFTCFQKRKSGNNMPNAFSICSTAVQSWENIITRSGNWDPCVFCKASCWKNAD